MEEMPTFLSITGMMFCILFIQNLIRALKDSIINALIGTEIISFLKFWGVMPTAFLVAFCYMKAVNIFDSRKIFYVILGSFLCFFIIFAFVIFPNHEALHLNTVQMNTLIAANPHMKWFILIGAKWGFSLFYIISELWPSVVVSLLFWQFVNQITNVEQSRRFYPLFGLFGQTGLVLSGMFLSELPYISRLFAGSHVTCLNEMAVKVVICFVVLLVLLGMFFFWFLNNKTPIKEKAIEFKVKRQKITLQESVRMILSSRYIRLVAIIMICYGAAINLAESPLKAEAAKHYNNVADFAAFAGRYLSYTGVLTLILVLINSSVVRKFGWFCAAIITPIVLTSTGLLFFAAMNFASIKIGLVNLFLVQDPLMIVIYCGILQTTLSKSTKYTFFDITKEMAYVPLPDELKTKGKAAVELIATKVGKSASSLMQSIVFIAIPTASYSSISMYLMYIFGIVCVVWLWAVRELAVSYKEITTKPT